MTAAACILAALLAAAPSTVPDAPDPAAAPPADLAVQAGWVATTGEVTRLAPTPTAAERSVAVEAGDGWRAGLLVTTPLAAATDWRFGVLVARHRLRIAEKGVWTGNGFLTGAYAGTRTADIELTVVEIPVGVAFRVPTPPRAVASTFHVFLGVRFDLRLGEEASASFRGRDLDTREAVARGVEAPDATLRHGLKFACGAGLVFPTARRPVTLEVAWAADLRDRLPAADDGGRERNPESVDEYLWQGVREQTLSVSAGVRF